jgi:Lar family restriction alleviation protein
MTPELLPCPFCGSRQIVVKTRKTTIVECGECGVFMIDYQDGVQRDVIAAWNTRAFPGAEIVSSESLASKKD